MKSFIAVGVVAAYLAAAQEKNCAELTACGDCAGAKGKDGDCLWCTDDGKPVCMVAGEESTCEAAVTDPKECPSDKPKCAELKDCATCAGVDGAEGACHFCADDGEGTNGVCADKCEEGKTDVAKADDCPATGPTTCDECTKAKGVFQSVLNASSVDNTCVPENAEVKCEAVADMPVGTVICAQAAKDCEALPVTDVGLGLAYPEGSCFGLGDCNDCVVKAEEPKCVWATKEIADAQASTGCIPVDFIADPTEGVTFFADEEACANAPTQSPDTGSGRTLTGALLAAAAATAFAVLF